LWQRDQEDHKKWLSSGLNNKKSMNQWFN
jgi:hypothetical protein